MLGRHVYRVHLDDGNWTVLKEGEDSPRAQYRKQEEAVAAASKLATADEPSRVIVDNGDGIILEERLFGSDLSQELRETAE